MIKAAKCSDCPTVFEWDHASGPTRIRCTPCQSEFRRETSRLRAVANYRANPGRARERSAAWRRANPELAREQVEAWKKANPERVKEAALAWRTANPERVREANAAGYSANREREKKRALAWYGANRERAKKRAAAWRKSNPIWYRDYAKNKRASDPVFRLKDQLRCRLREALAGKTKSARTLELLGCTPEFLKNYLESKFQPGMSWDLRGKIHIDHIRPCASFDLTDPEQQKRCFHYTNLQPLWAADNMRKSDKYEVTS